MDAPVCTDCHEEHTIQSPKDPSSSVYPTVVAEKTCGQCHASEKITSKYTLPPDRLKTYFESYHGLAGKYGTTTVANCASCHGAHDILPSSDPNSSVHRENLPKTCGQCHPNAGDQLTKGSIHISSTSLEGKIKYYITMFYIWLIVIVIGGMLIHNLLDFIPKLRTHYQRYTDKERYLRFSRRERAQHLILALSFILLAYTGFALRHADAWWATPFTIINFGFDIRGVLRRALAIVFCGLSVYHIGYLLRTKRGRGQLNALLPRKQDFIDLVRTIKYNLGSTKNRPLYKRYNHVEKLEYWALVWGSVIMVLTGGLLTFENFTMHYFPKWVLDAAMTIHYYEAVLATLAIIVWHFYFVIFDPHHYPLNLSMMTGKTLEEEKREISKHKKPDKEKI